MNKIFGLMLALSTFVSASNADEENESNLDKKDRVSPSMKPIYGQPIPQPLSFQQLRQQRVKPADTELSLKLLSSSLSQSSDAAVQLALLKGMLKGLEGKRDLSTPAGWSDVQSKLLQSQNSEVVRLATQLNQIFGDEAATRQLIETIKDTNQKVDQRRSALRQLVNQRVPEINTILRELLDDSDLRVDAIRAMGTIDYERAPRFLLGRFNKMDFQSQRATVETLASRKSFAQALLAGLKNKTLQKSDIPAYIARSLSQLLGDDFKSVFGDISELSQDKSALITKYKNLLTQNALSKANASNGRQLFAAVCAACHMIYGEGGEIGPDLTGSNRANIDYILLNMIDPSADIPDAYKQITITTADDQILVGTLAEEDDQKVVLKTVGQKVTILQKDIASRDVSALSMMPESLLPILQDSQVLDLVKYLQTTTQVPLP